MFDREWFVKHQKILLWLVNTPVIRTWFRYLLRIHGNRSAVGNRKIARILPNSILWVVKGGKRKVTVAEEFRTHDKFSKRIYYGLLPLWYLCHAWDMLLANNFHPAWNLGFDTTGNLYPSAGAVSPCDGYVANTNEDTTWANVRSGAGDTSDVVGANLYINAQASGTSGQYQKIFRSVTMYDTSSIGAGKQVDSGTHSLYITAVSNGLGSLALSLVNATPASTSTLANADYGNVGSTKQATDIAYASVSLNAYNDHTLNAAGKLGISLTGVSKFGLVLANDADNSAPTWAGSAISQFVASSADTTGTTQDPKLVIVYSLKASGGGAFLLNLI